MNKPTREQIEGKLREELHETVVLSAERGLAIVEYSKRVCELELELDKAFKRARMMETMAKKAEEERDKFADEIDVLEKARNEMREGAMRYAATASKKLRQPMEILDAKEFLASQQKKGK
jgi:hypothetical protein